MRFAHKAGYLFLDAFSPCSINKIQRASASKGKIAGSTKSQKTLGEAVFLTQLAARVRLLRYKGRKEIRIKIGN